MTHHVEDSRGFSGGRSGIVRLTLVVVAVAAVWNLVGNLLLPGSWYVPANLAVAVGSVALARAAGLGWSELGLDRGRLGPGFRYGMASMAAIGAVILLLVALASTRSFFESSDVAADGTAERWFTAIVRIPLGTAVFEEILFRGVLLAALLRLVSTWGAVVLNSLLFGLWHVVPAWEGAGSSGWAAGGAILGTVAVTAVAGVGFAWLRLRSDSVFAPILAHTATNSFAYVAAVVAVELATSGA